MIQCEKVFPKFCISGLVTFLFLLSACTHVEKAPEEIQPTDNPQTIALYEDCKAYLVDEDKDKHFCPTIIDVAMMSSWRGQMYILGAIRDDKLQRSALKSIENTIEKELECTPDNEPVLRYNGGKGMKDVVAKFVKEAPLNPEWKKATLSDVIGYSLISGFCMDHYSKKMRLAEESKDK